MVLRGAGQGVHRKGLIPPEAVLLLYRPTMKIIKHSLK
jgi:hypothetical protein